MTDKIIQLELMRALMEYLSNRPWREVEGLIHALNDSKDYIHPADSITTE